MLANEAQFYLGMAEIVDSSEPVSSAPAAVDHAVTTRFRLLMLLLLLGTIGVGLWVIVSTLPSNIYNPEWIFGENGNQLFRADQLHAGKALYRDMDCQYGPLPIWLWYGFTLLAGNTIAANVLFQNLLTLGLVALLFWWATQQTKRRDVVLVVALGLGALTFARTPYLYLIASPTANYEYLTFERLCLLGLMLLWRPPENRSLRFATGLTLVFFAWQGVKAGGAFVGLAAYGVVDLIWLWGQGHSIVYRPWIRWWLAVLAGVLLAESARCLWFIVSFGQEQGWRSAWPFYVADEYKRTWLALWVSPKHFITTILPIFGLLLPMVWLITRQLRARQQASAVRAGCNLLFQGAVGTMFYLLSAVPQVSYFGHEWHFFQYQWCLLPLALACLHFRPWLFLMLLLLVHAGAFDRTLKEFRRATPATELERLETPIGPVTFYTGDPRLAVTRSALAINAQSPGHRSLIMGGWGGGGWYVVAQTPHRPHNIFFSHAIIRRPQDDTEMAGLLTAADLVLVESRPPGSTTGTHLDWVGKVAGPVIAGQLQKEFIPQPVTQPAEKTSWILLRRRQ
jgi:hypothetical protein